MKMGVMKSCTERNILGGYRHAPLPHCGRVRLCVSDPVVFVGPRVLKQNRAMAVRVWGRTGWRSQRWARRARITRATRKYARRHATSRFMRAGLISLPAAVLSTNRFSRARPTDDPPLHGDRQGVGSTPFNSSGAR
jgi:hypothetical protein